MEASDPRRDNYDNINMELTHLPPEALISSLKVKKNNLTNKNSTNIFLILIEL